MCTYYNLIMTTTTVQSNLVREQLYSDMAPHHLTPLWRELHALVPKQPNTPCVPALWKYEHIRPYLMRSGEVITAEEAVRRVLILENPALKGQSAITQALYAGLQLIMPGEVAPQPPPHPKRAAFYCRRLRRLHSSERRTHHYAPGRFHHHAQYDVARSWK